MISSDGANEMREEWERNTMVVGEFKSEVEHALISGPGDHGDIEIAFRHVLASARVRFLDWHHSASTTRCKRFGKRWA